MIIVETVVIGLVGNALCGIAGWALHRFENSRLNKQFKKVMDTIKPPEQVAEPTPRDEEEIPSLHANPFPTPPKLCNPPSGRELRTDALSSHIRVQGSVVERLQGEDRRFFALHPEIAVPGGRAE
jgi:hypothetical protein